LKYLSKNIPIPPFEGGINSQDFLKLTALVMIRVDFHASCRPSVATWVFKYCTTRKIIGISRIKQQEPIQ